MRLQKTHKMILAGLLAVALTIPAATAVKTVHASETQLPFAQSEDGTVHETSFDLARVSDDKALSSYEKDNGKHWVKLFSKFDGVKNILDDAQLPDDTAKVKVVFDITNYDLDKAYPLTWATGIGGWASGKPTGVTIDQSGTYEAILDFASETDGIGKTISSADISAASIQLVFQLGEAKQEDIANVKKIHVNFKACYAYSASDEVKAASVVPIVDVTPTPVPTTPQETPAPTPGNTATPTATPDTNGKKVIPISKKTNKANVVKKIKATKKTVVIKKGKTKKVTFKLTTALKNTKTTDKIKSVKLSGKNKAKVLKKTLGKKTCTIKVKGVKKGKSVLKIKIGKKQAKVTIKIV